MISLDSSSILLHISPHTSGRTLCQPRPPQCLLPPVTPRFPTHATGGPLPPCLKKLQEEYFSLSRCQPSRRLVCGKGVSAAARRCPMWTSSGPICDKDPSRPSDQGRCWRVSPCPAGATTGVSRAIVRSFPRFPSQRQQTEATTVLRASKRVP